MVNRNNILEFNMAAKIVTCTGCLNVIEGKNKLKCCACNSMYDLICANVTEKRFYSFYGASGNNRKEWTCPKCISGRPKGDNLNTPIRVDKETYGQILEDSPPVSGVTQRSTARLANQGNTSLDKVDMISTIREEVRAAIRAELAPIKEQLVELKDSVQYMSNQYDDLIKTTDAIMEDNKSLKAECHQLRSTVSVMAARVETMEQYMRESNIEVQGIPQHKNENVVDIIEKIAEVVSFKLSDTDILTCTRVASVNKDSKRPRAIIAKLRSTRCRDEFYSAVARFNKSHPNNKLNSLMLGVGGVSSPVYVSEHLSPANKALHAAARAKAKALSYKFVWVRNGRIFMRRDETANFIHVKNCEVLERLQ